MMPGKRDLGHLGGALLWTFQHIWRLPRAAASTPGVVGWHLLLGNLGSGLIQNPALGSVGVGQVPIMKGRGRSFSPCQGERGINASRVEGRLGEKPDHAPPPCLQVDQSIFPLSRSLVHKFNHFVLELF